jgi:hypothetical protein
MNPLERNKMSIDPEVLELASDYEPSSEENIDAFEKKHRITLHDDHKKFLLEFDGLDFHNKSIYYKSFSGANFDIAYIYSLEQIEDQLTKEYTFEHIPVGEDHTGNILFQVLEQNDYYGNIFFWDHEMLFYGEPLSDFFGDDADTDDEESLLLENDDSELTQRICDSFDEFTDSLFIEN